MKKIGLLGGSFDPPHKGHLFISLEAKKILKLDEVWWLVTPKNPLKISEPASYGERVDNCKKITRNFPIKIQEIEKKIHSDYSYRTINYILKHYNSIKFFWLMGADNLINFHKWEKWQKIFNNMSIVVTSFLNAPMLIFCSLTNPDCNGMFKTNFSIAVAFAMP